MKWTYKFQVYNFYYLHFSFKGIDQQHLSVFSLKYFNKAVKKLSEKLLKVGGADEMLQISKQELRDDFNYVMRFCLLSYILR